MFINIAVDHAIASGTSVRPAGLPRGPTRKPSTFHFSAADFGLSTRFRPAAYEFRAFSGYEARHSRFHQVALRFAWIHRGFSSHARIDTSCARREFSREGSHARNRLIRHGRVPTPGLSRERKFCIRARLCSRHDTYQRLENHGSCAETCHRYHLAV